MDAARQVAQGTGVFCPEFLQEGVRVKARAHVQRGTDLAVDRVLNGHVDECAAQINYGVQFLGQAVVAVLAHDAGFHVGLAARAFEQVAARGGRDGLAGGAQKRNIPDDNLAADRKAGSDGGRRQRLAGLAQQFQDLLTARGSVHKSVHLIYDTLYYSRKPRGTQGRQPAYLRGQRWINGTEKGTPYSVPFPYI